MTESVLHVVLYASLTAIATGLGALPFIFFKTIWKRWLGYSNAVAAGLMLTASFTLIFEGLEYGLWGTVLGVFVGLGFIYGTHAWLEGKDNLSISNLGIAKECERVGFIFFINSISLKSSLFL